MTTINNFEGLLMEMSDINLKLYNESSNFLLANDLKRVSKGIKELESILNFLANERLRLRVNDGKFVLETTWSSQRVTPEFFNELETIMTKIPTLNDFLTN